MLSCHSSRCVYILLFIKIIKSALNLALGWVKVHLKQSKKEDADSGGSNYLLSPVWVLTESVTTTLARPTWSIEWPLQSGNKMRETSKYCTKAFTCNQCFFLYVQVIDRSNYKYSKTKNTNLQKQNKNKQTTPWNRGLASDVPVYESHCFSVSNPISIVFNR